MTDTKVLVGELNDLSTAQAGMFVRRLIHNLTIIAREIYDHENKVYRDSPQAYAINELIHHLIFQANEKDFTPQYIVDRLFDKRESIDRVLAKFAYERSYNSAKHAAPPNE